MTPIPESTSRIGRKLWPLQPRACAAPAYSQVADDAEWSSHPSNIISTTVSGTTTITIRPHPVFSKPTIYTATEKKTAVINLFKCNELQWKEWTAASMALH
jgi:hypothetical protein